MKIGIDLDGVVINFENTLRTYAEIYDLDILKGNHLIDKGKSKINGRYDWTDEQMETFLNEYIINSSKLSPIMPGFKIVYDLLKKENNIEFIVISARGADFEEMIDDAKRILKEADVEFDKYYWKQRDKLKICKKEKVDFMIDDDYYVADYLSKNGIKTIFYRDAGIMQLEENEFLIEVNNWGEIYRIIKNQIIKRNTMS